MITIKNIQNTATVTDGSSTIDLGAGGTYTCAPPSEQPGVLRFDLNEGTPSATLEIFISSGYGSVDWGDGSAIEDYTPSTSNVSISHNYSTIGVYDVSLLGFINLSLSSSVSARPKFLGFIDFNTNVISYNLFSRFSTQTLLFPIGGIIKAINMLSCFESSELSNLDNITIDSRACVTLRKCFLNSDLSTQDLSYMQTGAVSTFRDCFQGSDFNSNIGLWDVSGCSDFTNMFRFTSMDVSNCDAIFTGWLRWNSATSSPQITLISNESIHMGDTDYTRGGDAEDAHDYLVNTLNWTITFG